MQITHEQARKWIHLKSDAVLNSQRQRILDSHLDACAECREYAVSLEKMESVLRPLLQKQWNQQPIPLSIGTLISKGNLRTPVGMVMATRIAAMGVMFIAFLFSAWQFATFSPRGSSSETANVPSMPMPAASTELTSTQTGCGTISYVVGKNDTLASIASQFSIPMQEIILSNSLTSNTMVTGQQLVIPICTSTPTAAVEPLRTTFTPIRGRITSTPGG